MDLDKDVTIEFIVEAKTILAKDSALQRLDQVLPPNHMEIVEQALLVAFAYGYITYKTHLDTAIGRIHAEAIAKEGH